MSELLDTPEAAKVVGMSASTLNKLRLSGGGPAFYRIGKFCRYDRDELIAWMRSRRYTSTSAATVDQRGAAA